MGKNTTGNQMGQGEKTGRYCRMAYALNNEQPVRCTIVSDQPLFYMDFDGGFEDEVMETDSFGFDVIESGIETIKREIAAMDSLSERFEQKDTEVFQSFIENTVTAFSASTETGETASAEALADTLRKSRLGAAYLNFATQHKGGLRYSRQVATAFYDRRDGQVYINPDLKTADQLLLAARELRRLWQHRNGALVHPLTFHPDQAILVNRAQAADLSCAMVRIAWELQLAEEKGAWERLENSSMVDLAHAFAREAYLDFRTLNNGAAGSAVFESWFLSERCRSEDRKLIQAMLADYQGYVFDSEEASRVISADLVIALGTMPFGKNYLAPFAATIISDPVFTEIRDRSNANFLWFIKFERSFREAEQELHRDGETARGPRREVFHNDKKRSGDNEQENIVALHGSAQEQPFTQNRRAAAGGDSGGAKIIALHEWTGRK